MLTPRSLITATAKVTTSASVATTSVLLVGANVSRKGFILWNNSANSAYVSLADTSNSSTCTWIVATFTSLVYCFPVSYTGPISAIRNSGTGTITVYELV